MNKENIYKIYDKYGLFIILFFLMAVFTSINHNFLSLYNIQNIFKQSSINGLIAFGMTFVIILGAIDLSVGSILPLVGFVVGTLIVTFAIPVYIAIPLGLLLGVFLGVINGLLVSKQKLQPFIATLVTMAIYRGIVLVLSDGLPIRNISKHSEFMAWINKGSIGPLPIFMIILVITLLILMVVLHKTVFGKHVYATGGNEEAARLSTVPIDKVKIISYALCGFLTALAAILHLSRYNSMYPDVGIGSELDAIAAVVIGGTSMTGGRGRIMGTFIGVLIIGVLNNGLNLIGVSSFYQEIVKGLVILVAVIIDKSRNK
ncbi:ribose ABC transporter permease [Vibrio sp. SS-MA-C1-2]|uniref:ABC transporter permease n=1 Tax=Vibrio sp. SS-MA-C1-2 TaxID=2908646 RepID=UPI001F3E589B|nr:ribose ABC transporter permease [Vibrio sp. SS-MA-C1-2]UJF18491.1 ribose ABC transporter permease [Vibrio sp. SS-MA-C1-2]